jgi:hypothetical protein
MLYALPEEIMAMNVPAVIIRGDATGARHP